MPNTRKQRKNKKVGKRFTRKNKKGGNIGALMAGGMAGGLTFMTVYPMFLLWSMQKLIGVSRDYGMQMIGSGGPLGESCTAGNFKKHFSFIKKFSFKDIQVELFKIKKIMGINGKLCFKDEEDNIRPAASLIAESPDMAKRVSKEGEMSLDYFVAPTIKNDRYLKAKIVELTTEGKEVPSSLKPQRELIPSTVERPLRKIIEQFEKTHRALELCQHCYIFNKEHPSGNHKMFEKWDVEVKVNDEERIPYYKKVFQMYRNKCLHLIAIIGSIDQKVLRASPFLYKHSIVPVDIKLWLKFGACAVKFPNFLEELLEMYESDDKCIDGDKAKALFERANIKALRMLAIKKLKDISQKPISEAAREPRESGESREPEEKVITSGAQQEEVGAEEKEARISAAKAAGGSGQITQVGGNRDKTQVLKCISDSDIKIIKLLLDEEKEKELTSESEVDNFIRIIDDLNDLLKQTTITSECRNKIEELENEEIKDAIKMIDDVREKQKKKPSLQECLDNDDLDCAFDKIQQMYNSSRPELSLDEAVADLAEKYAERSSDKVNTVDKIEALQKLITMVKGEPKERVERALQKAKEYRSSALQTENLDDVRPPLYTPPEQPEGQTQEQLAGQTQEQLAGQEQEQEQE